MFKKLFFGFAFALAGALLAYLLLLNPFGWEWLSPMQYTLQHASLTEGPEHGGDESSGQLWTCGMHPQVIQDEPGDCPICGMALTPLKSGSGELQEHDHSAVSGDESSGQLWTCGMHPQVIQDEPGDCPICGMALTPLKGSGDSAGGSGSADKKIKYWVAPMDPNYISDKPGKSPMGMDLVPVYEEGDGQAEASGIVNIDPSFVQNIGVQWIEVERRDIPFTIRTIGTVAYNDQRVSLVTVKYEGWIEGVTVNYVGESVKKGQKLFEVYSPELVTTQKEYLNAQDYLEKMGQADYPEIRQRAESLLASSRERLRNWDFTPEQIDELASSRKPRRTVPVFSPADGVVISRMDQTLEGMRATPGMILYRIADLSTVWVEAEIFESQLPWLKVGQEAILEFPSLPGRQFKGTIHYLYPFLDQQTRTMRVSIELPNPDMSLRKGMYADVTFDVPAASQVLTVPEDSVIHTGEREVVVLSLGNGKFQVREVELGINSDDVWEVKRGVEEGDQVVTSSQFLIDSESNLKAAIQKTIAARKGAGSSAEMNEEGGPVDSSSDDLPGDVHR